MVIHSISPDSYFISTVAGPLATIFAPTTVPIFVRVTTSTKELNFMSPFMIVSLIWFLITLGDTPSAVILGSLGAQTHCRGRISPIRRLPDKNSGIQARDFRTCRENAGTQPDVILAITISYL